MLSGPQLATADHPSRENSKPRRNTMLTGKPGPGQLIAGAGGALLIISLFLPWADVQGVSRSGWELWTMADVFFLIAGLIALGAAITGGAPRGFFPAPAPYRAPRLARARPP